MADVSDDRVELFLKKVRVRLRGISEHEIGDILQELRSHILDRIAGTGGLSKVSVSDAIQSMGSPEKLASEYMTEQLIARAQLSRAPSAVMRVIVRWASISASGFLALIICGCGYVLGGIFLLCAVLKPFDPTGVGLWVRTNPLGLSLLVGAVDHGPRAHEILGWWIVPAGIVAGAGLFVLTTKFGLWAILRFQHTRGNYSDHRTE